MANKLQNFEQIFRAQDPLTTDSFRLLLGEVATSTNPQPLREFLVQLNGELYRVLWDDNTRKTAWAEALLRALLNANQELAVNTLRDLMEEKQLHYHDPLVKVVFETAAQTLPLLYLLADIVQVDHQLLDCRVRLMEVLYIKLSQEGEPRHTQTGVTAVLRFLNKILDLKNEVITGIKDLNQSLSERFKIIHKLSSDLLNDEAGRILKLVQEALEKLAVDSNAPETIRIVLEILKANSPLPVWYSASAPCVQRVVWNSRDMEQAREENADRRSKEDRLSMPQYRYFGLRWQVMNHLYQSDTQVVLALMIDKVVEIVLTIANAKWRSKMYRQIEYSMWKTILPEPSNPSVLESILVDQNSSPKARNMSAALLRILSCTFPSIRPSPRAEFYSDLFLIPLSRPGSVHEVPERRVDASIIDTKEKILFLLEAFDEKSDFVRWNASKVCYRAAQDHPEWFMPEHHFKLLPLLSDNHERVRLNILRTFRALSSYRDRGMTAMIQDISKRLSEKVSKTEDQVSIPQELEAALGMIFDSLSKRVDHLQRQVQWLETKRKILLDHIEKQALRIGEEIHHEILNTRCGYLATSIDEEEYTEAKKRLDELVTDLRRIMNNLYPKDLEAEGFLATIRNRLEDAKKQIQRRMPAFTVEFDCPEEITNEKIMENLRDKSHLVLLYRIVLEAIVNARKHARGTSISVKLHSPAAGLIDISISDHGSGNGGPFKENVGLSLMRQRAEEIGAEIEYKKTSQAGGTTVVIHLPAKQIGVTER